LEAVSGTAPDTSGRRVADPDAARHAGAARSAEAACVSYSTLGADTGYGRRIRHQPTGKPGLELPRELRLAMSARVLFGQERDGMHDCPPAVPRQLHLSLLTTPPTV
jgi:hypothetical protein